MRSWSLRRPDGVALVGESRGQGESVVLVHPTGMTRRGLAATAEHLARHLRVVTYDRRGWGDSRGSVAPQRWWATHGDDLIAVIESMGEAAEVVAWAGGSAAAIHAALRRPELVRQLVLFEPTIGAGPPRPAGCGTSDARWHGRRWASSAAAARCSGGRRRSAGCGRRRPGTADSHVLSTMFVRTFARCC
ncbi:alpha/beta fold hydrolase [Nannocystis pusilla]|uniref:alpha/beta fold hydrolase n=1 Tax=Nannocystis pusilla TaxID=889268 RepID=UPI003B828947